MAITIGFTTARLKNVKFYLIRRSATANFSRQQCGAPEIAVLDTVWLPLKIYHFQYNHQVSCIFTLLLPIYFGSINFFNMVSLEIIESSNNRIRSALPAGLVAVFVGGTNGVGETTVRQFAKHTVQPRVYIIGRSQDAGDRITAECKALNPDGNFIFLKRETSLMRSVDEICKELATKEEAINLLFLTVGTLQSGISKSLPS